MIPNLLSLDPGRLVGWALRGQNGTIASGTVSFQPASFEGDGMRYVRFTRWLSELHAIAGGIHALYFEQRRNHVGMEAAHIYGGFLGHLSAWCETHAVPYRGVPIAIIKRHATGQGNATHEALLEAVRERGHRPFDEHEADALALLHWLIETQELTA